MGGTPAARRTPPPVVIGVTWNPTPEWNRLRRPEFFAEARRRGWRLAILRGPHWLPPAGPKLAGALLQKLPDRALIGRLKRMRCPVVTLGRWILPHASKCPSVQDDPAAQGRMAAEYFAARSFRQVGYLHIEGLPADRPIFDTFRATAEALGMRCFALHRPSLRWWGTGRDDARGPTVGKWLRERPKPLGLLCPSDSIAADLALHILAAGWRVPEDVALLGRGNDPVLCEGNYPALSSLDIDLEGEIRVACALLARLMEGASAPMQPVLVPPRGIVERESTSVLGVTDPAVAAAVRHMWDHLDRDLSVDDVAAAAGIPRRSLERAFHDHLGRGVAAEMLRRRLEVFERLLVSTDEPIAELAPRVGLRSMSHLRRIFHRAFGMSPRSHRMRKRA